MICYRSKGFLRDAAFPLVINIVTLLALANCAPAQSSPPNHARVELISEQSAFPSAGPLSMGFLFILDQGWHIYWQNPGDSGEPPRFEWKLPKELEVGAMKWPRPVRLGNGTIIDYGYEDQVLLMVPLHFAPGTPPVSSATIAADVKYIVCREICVPGKTSLSLALPLAADQAAHVPEWRGIFERTRSQLPKSVPTSWRISAVAGKNAFTLSVTGRRDRRVMFFPLDPSVVENSAPQNVVPTDDGFNITLRASDQLLKQVSALRGLLVFNNGQAFQIAAPVSVR